MRKILIVSPHFDDAILSAGEHMAGRPDAEVITVFGGYPEDPENTVTPYDKKCGFKNAEHAVSARRHENDRATALLHATKIDLDFPDSQYGERVDQEEVTEQLQRFVDGQDYEYIMAPLGLAHPDHILTTAAVLALETDLPIYLWEDLPLRVVEPELVPKRLKELGIDVPVWNANTNREKIAEKIRALSCYGSQIGTGILDPFLLYVPERFYRL
jgi:LmbE family N-acetylglucosaminyl deacetylase